MNPRSRQAQPDLSELAPWSAMDLTERMTDRSRAVLSIADREARKRAAIEIAPAHLLLALAVEGHGVAAYVLRILGVTPERVATKLPPIPQSAIGSVDSLPLAPSSRKVIRIAWDRASELHHQYIGTEHLVLGAASVIEQESPRWLGELGLTADDVRRETYALLGHLT